jgi:hypothetical protein
VIGQTSTPKLNKTKGKTEVVFTKRKREFLKNQILIIKRGGSGEMKLDIQWLTEDKLQKKVGMAVACWCWLVVLLRETDQCRRDGYKTRGNQPDEEGG